MKYGQLKAGVSNAQEVHAASRVETAVEIWSTEVVSDAWEVHVVLLAQIYGDLDTGRLEMMGSNVQEVKIPS